MTDSFPQTPEGFRRYSEISVRTERCTFDFQWISVENCFSRLFSLIPITVDCYQERILMGVTQRESPDYDD